MMEYERNKEELTTKLHSEFGVSKEIDVRNNVFSILTFADYENKKQLQKYCDMFGITILDVEKYKPIFDELKK